MTLEIIQITIREDGKLKTCKVHGKLKTKLEYCLSSVSNLDNDLEQDKAINKIVKRDYASVRDLPI